MKEISIEQHNIEIQRNLTFWNKKPILKAIYNEFYTLIAKQLNLTLDGRIVELGSGIGNIKLQIPEAICTDIFKNPWIDQVENAYALNFENNSLSNLILFDVFHHIEYPGSALAEFNRVLKPHGRVIIFEPSISLTGLVVYGIFHHEPVGMMKKIQWNVPDGFDPWNSEYYAAQGNAERIFFQKRQKGLLSGWNIITLKKYSSLAYVLSGGYSKPQLFPDILYKTLRHLEKLLDYFPLLFSTRVLVVLQKQS
jgi:SAM-dependent methyltransferase